jgi:hypothetical protein
MPQGRKLAALTLAVAAALAGAASAQEGEVILAPPPGAPGPGPGVFIAPGLIGSRGSGAMLLRMPQVQSELKLTAEQKAKWAALLRRLREAQRVRFQELPDLTSAERAKRQAEWRASDEKQVAALLTADQQKRYRQLQLQQEGLPALLEPDVAAELRLTDEQRAGVQSALREQGEAMRFLLRPGPGGFDPEQMHQKIQALFRQRDEKIQAALTPDQRRQWQVMLGAPFAFPQFGAHHHEPREGRAPEDAPLLAEPPEILPPASP